MKLSRLLAADVTLVHRTRRDLFEKRIIRVDGDNFVLYRFPLSNRAKRLVNLLRTAEELGIPMQRLVDPGDARFSWHAPGYWLVTRFEPGNIWDEHPIDLRHAVNLAHALAGMHAIHADRYGRLFELGDAFSLKGKVLAESMKAIRFAHVFTPQQKGEMERWVKQHASLLAPSNGYQLVHGDLSGKNLVAKEDGTVCLIDYELIAYELAGLDLAHAFLNLFNGMREVHRAGFLAAYVERRGAEFQADWETNAAAYLVYALMRMACSRQRRARILAQRQGVDAAVEANRVYGIFLQNAYTLVQAEKEGIADPLSLFGLLTQA